MAKRVVVTGGNNGIGLALCQQLAIKHGCFVYLGSRSIQKGEAAVQSIVDAAPDAKCEFVQIDTTSDESVAAAAETIKSKLGPDETLYGIVNNAGTGLRHGVDETVVMETNLYGVKRMCEAFIPLLSTTEGRIVNVGSGAGPSYVSRCTPEVKRQLCKEDQTWEEIQAHAQAGVGSEADTMGGYGVSKALLTNYTSYLAKEYPDLKINCCTPGFIDTDIVRGYGAKKKPAEGTVAIKHLLLGELAGNGWYYGSDAVRSPLHFMRNPGEPEYDGVVPDFE